MYTLSRIFTLVMLIIISVSCTERLPIAPDLPFESSTMTTLQKHYEPVTVMSRNIYVGADVDVIINEPNPENIPIRVAEAFQTLIATNFPERAEALAKEVAETNPQLIGLQEVSTIRTQFPSDAVVGGTTPAENVFMDYLEILKQTLQAYGLNYQVVGIIENSDVEVPMVSNLEPLEFTDVRLTDYDVVLARHDVIVKGVKTGNFRKKLEVPNLGINIPRGYVSCRVEIEGCDYMFVNTHLEPADYGGKALTVQTSQARELMSMLAPVKIPVIIVGDFNSEAETGKTYQIITGNHRYFDVWMQNTLSDNPLGYTFGHEADLSNTTPNFWQRIDYVFVRAQKQMNRWTEVRGVEVIVVGDEVGDKTPSGLWPSDHGGVVATFQIVCDDNAKHDGKNRFKNK